MLLLKVIQRIGHWLLDSFGTAYIVPGFTAEALLALAFWPGAAQKDFTGYWAERFHVAVPELLIQLLMPGLAALEVEAAAAAAAGSPSAEADNLCKGLRMGAVVLVQDALELAEQFPNNPVHKILLEQQVFRWVLVTAWLLCVYVGEQYLLPRCDCFLPLRMSRSCGAAPDEVQGLVSPC